MTVAQPTTIHDHVDTNTTTPVSFSILPLIMRLRSIHGGDGTFASSSSHSNNNMEQSSTTTSTTTTSSQVSLMDYKRYRSYLIRRLSKLRSKTDSKHGKGTKYHSIDLEQKMKKPLNEWKFQPQLTHFLELILLTSEKNWAQANELRMENVQLNDSRVRFHMIRRLKKSFACAQQLNKILNDLSTQQQQQQQQNSNNNNNNSSQASENNIVLFPSFVHQPLNHVHVLLLESQIYLNDLLAQIELELESFEEALKHLIQLKALLFQHWWKQIQQITTATGGGGDRMIQLYLNRKREELDTGIRFCSYNLGVSVVGDESSSSFDLNNQTTTVAAPVNVTTTATTTGGVGVGGSKNEQIVINDKTVLSVHSLPKMSNLLIKIYDLEAQIVEITSGSSFESRHMRVFDQLVFAYMEAEKLIQRELVNNSTTSTTTTSDNKTQQLSVNELKMIATWISKKLVAVFVKRNVWNVRNVLGEKQSQFVENKSLVRPYDIVKILDSTLHRMKDSTEFAAASPYALHYMQTLRVLFLSLAYYRRSKEAECQLLALRGQQMLSDLQSMTNKDSESLCLHLLPKVETIESELRKLNVLVRAQYAQRALNLSASLEVPEDREEAEDASSKLRVTQFPPAFESIACKPTFFDIAGSGVEYPEVELPAKTAATTTTTTGSPAAEEEPKKKGWFGLW